ncbi:hypothetical protein LINPERHAP2_LOCUS21935 [Linum perenne]
MTQPKIRFASCDCFMLGPLPALQIHLKYTAFALWVSDFLCRQQELD